MNKWVKRSLIVVAVAGVAGIVWWTLTTDEVPSTPTSISEQKYITIGSFNIYQFGKGSLHENRDLGGLARLLIGMDLVVLQEVGTTHGENQVSALKDSMNRLLPDDSKKYKTPLVTNETGNSEKYAFIYRDPVIRPDAYKNPNTSGGEWWMRPDPDDDGVYTEDEIYDRVPAYMYFRAGNFDFVVITVHLMWTHLDKRETEIDSLREWFSNFTPLDGERDVILLGDFNRYGKYSGVSIEEMAFSKFFSDGWQDEYRILFTEPLATHTTKFAEEDSQSTTVGSANNLYDQILISKSVEHEFGADKAMYGQSIGVLPFDMVAPYNNMHTNSIKVRMSDHRPIYARFRIDQPDDDP